MDHSTPGSPSFTVSRNLLRFMSIESVMPSNRLILCRPLLLLPSTFPSIRIFSKKSALCIRWPKYRSFSFSISTSNECSVLISSRIDWFDLLAILGGQALMLFQGICPKTPTPPPPQVKLKPTVPRTEEEKTEHSVAAERRRMRLVYADTIKDLLANCVIQDGERHG